MRTACVLIAALVTAAACAKAPTAPTRQPIPESTNPAEGGVPNPSTAVIAVYDATFTASAACASQLEPDSRERTYTATLLADGRIAWAGPTLHSPPGHQVISSGVLSDEQLSFSIDVERDPQSDDFHGLTDVFGNGALLNISGKGSGTVRGAEITGSFDGLFAFYGPVDPPQPGILMAGRYCRATDHQFRFLKQ